MKVRRLSKNQNRWEVRDNPRRTRDGHIWYVLHKVDGWIIIGTRGYVHPAKSVGRRVLRAVSEFNEKEVEAYENAGAP